MESSVDEEAHQQKIQTICKQTIYSAEEAAAQLREHGGNEINVLKHYFKVASKCAHALPQNGEREPETGQQKKFSVMREMLDTSKVSNPNKTLVETKKEVEKLNMLAEEKREKEEREKAIAEGKPLPPPPEPAKKHQFVVKSGDILFWIGSRGFHFDSKSSISEVARQIHGMLLGNKKKIDHLVDFGGVAEHFLGGRGEGVDYLENPPTISVPNAYIFSFVPPNKRFLGVDQMYECISKAGFESMIICTQKQGKRGKAALALELSNLYDMTYWDDTAAILDEIRAKTDLIQCRWVQPDEGPFRNMTPTHSGVQTVSIEEFLSTFGVSRQV